MNSSKIPGWSHPDRSQLGSFTIALACCVVVMGVAVGSYRRVRATGVIVVAVVLGSSMSMLSLPAVSSLSEEIVGECSAGRLLGFLSIERLTGVELLCE